VYRRMALENPGKYPENMGKPWSDEEIIELLLGIRDKKTYEQIAEKHKRTVSAITSRLRHLACEYHIEGKTIEQIQKFTGLSKDTVLDAITRHQVRQANNEKKREQKQQAKMNTLSNTKVDLPENEVLKYLKEIHSMLKELTSKAASNM
jgi:hypothetical protein